MCFDAVLRCACTLYYVPDHFKTQEISNEVIWALKFIPDHLKTQEMCNKAVGACPWQPEYVPNRFKTQAVCNEVVRLGPWNQRYIPDWFVTQHQVKSWHDNVYYCNDNRHIKWYKGYRNRMAQKAKIKDKLVPIVWYPDRVMNWCMSEDEKVWWK